MTIGRSRAAKGWCRRPDGGGRARAEERVASLPPLRERTLQPGAGIAPAERGAIPALLGTAERAFALIGRIDAERSSVTRVRRPEPAAAAA